MKAISQAKQENTNLPTHEKQSIIHNLLSGLGAKVTVASIIDRTLLLLLISQYRLEVELDMSENVCGTLQSSESSRVTAVFRKFFGHETE